MDSVDIQHKRHGTVGRYSLTQDNAEAELTYSLSGSRMTIHHTFVPPALRGHGLAQALVRRAVEDARKENFKIVPNCWFAREEIARHPEWQDLLAAL